MRILCFNWRDITHPWGGGAEVFLHEITKRFVPEHEVVWFCGKYEGCREEDEIDGIRIIRRGERFSVYLHAMFNYLFRLRRQNFDIVIDSINGVPFFTPLFVRKPKVAIIHHLMKKDVFFRELPLPAAFVAWLAERMIPFLYRKVPVVTVSNSSRQEIAESGIPDEMLRIIHNAVEHEALGCGVKSARPVIAYVGRIKRYKQVDHLLQAFELVREAMPEAELVVAGRGGQNLKKLVGSNPNSNSITLAGEISEEEKAEILKRAWVFVSPSMKEGWGITVIEANACGTPAIGYNVPGLRDSIRDGETGLLVPHGDIEQLAKAIIAVLTDSELRARLSRNALEWSSRFSWDNSAEEFLEILEQRI